MNIAHCKKYYSIKNIEIYNCKKGILYLVSTPIGNLGDLTFRSKDVLEKVDKIYAEDTRTTKKLLSHYSIKTPIFSYHQHNEHHVVDTIISEIIEKDIQYLDKMIDIKEA